VSHQAERRHYKMYNEHWKSLASNSLARRLIGLVSDFLLRGPTPSEYLLATSRPRLTTGLAESLDTLLIGTPPIDRACGFRQNDESLGLAPIFILDYSRISADPSSGIQFVLLLFLPVMDLRESYAEP
jgi:hypothetical protein